MTKVIDRNGKEIDFDAAVQLMDEDLREKVHGEFSGETEQEFIEAYAEAHIEKFGENFAPYEGGAW